MVNHHGIIDYYLFVYTTERFLRITKFRTPIHQTASNFVEQRIYSKPLH